MIDILPHTKEDKLLNLNNQLFRLFRKNNYRGHLNSIVEPAFCGSFIQINTPKTLYFVNFDDTLNNWRVLDKKGKLIWQNRYYYRNNRIITKLLKIVETDLEISS